MTQSIVYPERDKSSAPAAIGNASGVDRPIADILKDLFEHAQVLAKQELQLAGAELDEKINKAKTDLTAPILGGAVLYAGLLSIVAALVLLLAQAMPGWLAALIVGGVIGGIGFALIKRASAPDAKFRRVPPNVQSDIQTFKEAIK